MRLVLVLGVAAQLAQVCGGTQEGTEHTTLTTSTEDPTTPAELDVVHHTTLEPDTTDDPFTPDSDFEHAGGVDQSGGIAANNVQRLLDNGSYGNASTIEIDQSRGHNPTHVVKISYLAMRGLADLPVLMLEAARYPYKATYYGKADFAKVKPTLLFGRVPMLEIPGTETEPGGTLAQSAVIVRALAQRLGLDGRNTDPNNTPLASIHVGEVDMWYETINELFKQHSRWGKAFDAKALKAAVEASIDGTELRPGLTFRDTTNGGEYTAEAKSLMVLQTFESVLQNNGGTHLVARRLTYADLALWCELDKLDEEWPLWSTLSGASWHPGFPSLATFKRAIEHDAGLAGYLLSDRRMPRVERRADGNYHYLKSLRPAASEHTKSGEICCKALTAPCLACMHGITEDELCAKTAVAGCPTPAHTGEL